ncbi:acyl-CoA dehydrogenase family protein [Candidatus Zixiibacteriota bacterium]
MQLTDEAQMVREMVRGFAENELRPIAAEIDRDERFPTESVAQMAELGLLGITIPEDEGGSGMDTLCYAIAVEETARVCGSTALILAAHISLACQPLHLFGSAAQKEKYLQPLASGDVIGSYGLSEADAGSDAGATKTTARLEGDYWVVNGSKMWITNALQSGTMVFTARTGGQEDGTRDISSFIVDPRTEGVTVNPIKGKLGVRGSTTCEVVFEDVRIPPEDLLGDPGKGFKQFLTILDGGRISIGAMALGLAQGAYEEALRFAQEREQFGRTIGKFQAVAFTLAEMATRIEAARHLVYSAAIKKEAGENIISASAMAKYYASETAQWVTTKAIQLHGGYGYTKEYPVERMWRDAKLTTIGEGTSEIQLLVISREILTEL